MLNKISQRFGFKDEKTRNAASMDGGKAAWTHSVFDGIIQDVRFALRALKRTPGVTVTAAVTLALGIGINATVFTVTNAVLFKGFPLVSENNRLVYISNKGCCISYPDFAAYRELATVFDRLAIVQRTGLVFQDQSGNPENLDGTEVSADTFKLVGQRPIIGRDFTPADEVSGAAGVAILSYRFWERRYARDSAIIGRTIRINGEPTTYIGIMPEGFSFPQKADLWMPLVKSSKVLSRSSRDTWFTVGLLKPGVSISRARAEIDAISKDLASTYPLTNQDMQPTLKPFHEFFIGTDTVLLYLSMWGAVAFVLMIACANLANLLLARALTRSREISLRIALGASRFRILRQLLIESTTLSLIGGLFGWFVAVWGVRAYSMAMTRKAPWLVVDYSMDYRAMGYLLMLSVGTGIVFGLAPAFRLLGVNVNSTLKDGARGTTSGGRGKRLSAILVTGEVALAVVLLAGAGVMIRSFLKVHGASMGIDTNNVLVSIISLPNTRYSTPASQVAFFNRLTERAGAVPGVDSVALADRVPQFGARRLSYELGIQGGEAHRGDRNHPKSLVVTIGPGYFRTLGAKLFSGRDFERRDGAAAVQVALVNERFARKSWPGQSATGKQLRLLTGNVSDPWLTVVGVVSNIVQSDETRQSFDPVIYVPFEQHPKAGMMILSRSRIASAAAERELRREVLALDPNLPMYGPSSLAWTCPLN